VYDPLTYGQTFLDAHATTATLLSGQCTPVMSAAVEPIGDTGQGRFTFSNVPGGRYTLYIHRPGWLPRTLDVMAPVTPGALVNAQPPDGPVFTLLPGDVNGDGVVDRSDWRILFGRMFTEFGQPNYLAEADLNADGRINAIDRSILFTNRGRRSSDYPGFDGCVLQ